MNSATNTAPGRKRPEFRNIHVFQILRYRLPPAGVVSILHRISGGFLFLVLPWLLWLFELSLMSETSYERLRELGSGVFVKLVLLAVIWSFAHHFFAGVRFLLLDLHIGIEKVPATRGAVLVYVFSIPVTIAAGLWLFGVI
jgi:succinate dehydrogenase / fumarate reductase, cytochrome b subunit